MILGRRGSGRVGLVAKDVWPAHIAQRQQKSADNDEALTRDRVREGAIAKFGAGYTSPIPGGLAEFHVRISKARISKARSFLPLC